MNVTLSSLAVFPLLAFSAAACAIAPATTADGHEGTVSSEMLSPLPPPGRVPTLSAMSLCSTTTADRSSGYPAEPGILVTGTSNAAATCDYYVTEVTGVQGTDIKLAIYADPELITDQASCEESTEAFATFGFVPGHVIGTLSGRGEYVLGQWESIASQLIQGEWLSPVVSGQPNCAFNAFIYPTSATGTASAIVSDSPYSTIRVATQAIYYSNGAGYRAPMGTYVVPAP
jgi:hypothetical protein